MKLANINVYISLLFILLFPTVHFAMTTEKIFVKASPSVHAIYTDQYQKSSDLDINEATAIAITKRILVAKCHLLATDSKIFIKLDSKVQQVHPFYHNLDEDICMYMLSTGELTPVQIRATSDVRINEVAYVIGNQMLQEKTISTGKITNRMPIEKTFLLETNAAIPTGSSGGGLFDSEGRLIGIVSLKTTGKIGIGVAIPTEWLITKIPMLQPDLIYINKKMSKKTKETTKNMKISSNTYSIIQDKKKVFNLLGKFGNDNVEAYTYKKTCIIYAAGKSSTIRHPATMLILKNKPRTIFIFPNDNNLEKATEMLYEYQNYPIKSSQSYLILDDMIYNLDGYFTKNHQFPIYWAKLNKPFQDVISSQSKIIVHFHDNPHYDRVFFNIHGFNMAYKTMSMICHN